MKRREDGALELRWGPDVDYSRERLVEPTIWGRMAGDVSETASAALALLGLGWISDWPYFGAIAAAVFVAGLIPGWLRARREHARTQRSGTMLITSEALELTDTRGTASIPLEDIVDLDATARDGLELFCRDGVTTTMESLRSETTLTVAESLRAGLGLAGDGGRSAPERMSMSGRIEVEDDDVGRLIHVTHNWLTAGGARRYARAMLVGAIGTAYLSATTPISPTIWLVVAASLAGAMVLLRPRKISRLRLRHDGSYVLECHQGELQAGLLKDVTDVVVDDGRIKLLTEPSLMAMDGQTDKLRQILQQFRERPGAGDDEVVFDTSEDEEVREEVEAVVEQSR